MYKYFSFLSSQYLGFQLAFSILEQVLRMNVCVPKNSNAEVLVLSVVVFGGEAFESN